MNNTDKSKAWLRIIGDVHGHYDEYVRIAEKAEYSLQIGDLGFEYECLKKLDPERHKVLAGNHDNYDKWGTNKFIHMQTGHWLGDYGVHSVPEFGDIFFVRGGFSIDWRYRTEGKSFWKDEELTYGEMSKALELYKDVKPTHVFTHECPGSLSDAAFGIKLWDGEPLRPSNTAKLLDEMWSAHDPKMWVFGHHHRLFTTNIRGTVFRCIPELGFIDIDKNEKIIVYSEEFSSPSELPI